MSTAPATAAEIAAIVAGRHGDAFAVLGPHGDLLRVFVPGAEAVFVGDVALTQRDPAGFFEGAAGTRHAPLRARAGDTEWAFIDPYGFGPALGPLDDHLLLEGTHARLADRLGAHPCTHEGVAGTRFAVWAPHAQRVSVVGGFNAWDGRRHPMRRRVDSGIWELFLPGIGPGEAYKYELIGPDGALLPLKADPVGFAAELRPATASVVTDNRDFPWTDAAWLSRRDLAALRRAPVAIYEVHATSWRRHPDGRFYSWDELAASLIPWVVDLGFTHVELMPVMEHPLDLSWGYQTIGMFAVTARLGDPAGLARFTDAAHAAGIGVILDWVPAHFPKDAHGLTRFDGTPLYEHPDTRRGEHPDWGTMVFDYGRTEVAAYLASNALFWLERYHADGLRVDAVSSMIQLDYSRPHGQWAANEDGSNENRDATGFLRRLNSLVTAETPGAMMIAEESTAWAGVTAPPDWGGLGFGFKWNMGWMNDTLRYMALDPIHRRFHHHVMTFGITYAWSEAFILPLSHDEVVHGKGTLLGRMPGDDWQRFANARLLFAWQWAHPGKKLLFMGQEWGQWREWSEDRELDWALLQHAQHQGLLDLVRDLNRLHRAEPALHEQDTDPLGFQWIDADDAERSVYAFLRWDSAGKRPIAVILNFTPVPRHGYAVGLPWEGVWREVLNTDATVYAGSGLGNAGAVEARALPWRHFPASATVTLPPLGALFLLAPEAPTDAG